MYLQNERRPRFVGLVCFFSFSGKRSDPRPSRPRFRRTWSSDGNRSTRNEGFAISLVCDKTMPCELPVHVRISAGRRRVYLSVDRPPDIFVLPTATARTSRTVNATAQRNNHADDTRIVGLVTKSERNKTHAMRSLSLCTVVQATGMLSFSEINITRRPEMEIITRLAVIIPHKSHLEHRTNWRLIGFVFV